MMMDGDKGSEMTGKTKAETKRSGLQHKGEGLRLELKIQSEVTCYCINQAVELSCQGCPRPHQI